jgi:transposase InsO family protein
MREKKETTELAVRTAEQPGVAMNVDLCFVPCEHEDASKLPAVSGSSGHLVVERQTDAKEAPHWPGQVFAEAELEYEEAMQRYARETRDRLKRGKIDPRLPEAEPTAWRKGWEARAKRHQTLQERRQADADWLAERKAHHQIVDAYRALSRPGRAEVASRWEAEKAHWAKREAERLEVLKKRKQENLEWHQRNRDRQASEDPAVRTWLAILVMTDNCTRECLSLPIFASGSKLTAEEVVTALRMHLPKDLAFLISDQGTHFRCKSLALLAQEVDFIQIPIYRHRPQTNGIAERFVLTLKQWLKKQSWDGIEQLGDLLAIFRPEYNNRPHQGLAIPGLSPTEFTNRLWLM